MEALSSNIPPPEDAVEGGGESCDISSHFLFLSMNALLFSLDALFVALFPRSLLLFEVVDVDVDAIGFRSLDDVLFPSFFRIMNRIPIVALESFFATATAEPPTLEILSGTLLRCSDGVSFLGLDDPGFHIILLPHHW
jgi:hypothetical protein